MKRLIVFLLMPLMGIGSALAQYTWIGGSTFDATSWAGLDNWNGISATTMPGTGPGTPNSNLWNEMSIIGTDGRVTGTTPLLEGWNIRMVLDNADVTVSNLNKVQGGESKYFTLKGSSTLTVNFQFGIDNQNQYDLNVNLQDNDASRFNLVLGQNYDRQSGQGLIFNYATVSQNMARGVSISSKDNAARTIGNITINATLPESVNSDETTLNSATLATISSDITVTNKVYNITGGNFTEAAADGELSANNENIGKYKVVEQEDGNIVLQWVTGPGDFFTVRFDYTANFGEGNTYTTSVTRTYGSGTVLTSAPDPNIDFYTASPINHTVSGDASIDVPLVPSFPFVHNQPTWLSSIGSAANGGLRQIQYGNDSKINIDLNGNSKVASNVNTWIFIHVNGTADQFQIKNGTGKYLNVPTGGNGTVACTLSDTPQTFTIQKSTQTSNNTDAETGFCIKVEDNSFMGAHIGAQSPNIQIGNLTLWASDQLGIWKNANSNAANSGSLFYAIEISDDDLADIKSQPAAGFYRLRFDTNSSTPYLGSTGGDGANTVSMTADEDASSIVYVEEAENGRFYLMTYDNGYYLANPYRLGVGTETIQNSEIYKQAWTVEAGAEEGCCALKYGSAGNYMTGDASAVSYSESKSDAANGWIFEPVTVLPLTTNEDGYTSFSAPVPVTIPGDCYAYVATDKGDGVVNMTKVTGNVAANTGLIIKTESASIPLSFSIVESGNTVDNMLVANAAASMVAKVNNYFFGKYTGNNEYVFTKIAGDGSRELKGHKAYLDGTGLSEARLFLLWGDDVETSIEASLGEQAAVRNGKFVKDGRVIIVKNSVKYTTSGLQIK